MAVSDWMTTTFSVYRQTYTANKSAEVLQGTVAGHLQQASQEQVVAYANSVRLTHAIWCAVDADVEVGDKMTANSRTWKVRGVQVNDTGQNTHLEILAEEAQ